VVDGRHERREAEPQAANAQAATKDDRDDQGQVLEPELEHAERLTAREHERYDRDVARRQQAGPQDLAPHHMTQLDLRRELAFPRALIAHPDERPEERLEDRRR